MNKRYEEGRKPFFSESGEKMRKQYVWAKDEKGKEVLQETAPIDIQQEIESNYKMVKKVSNIEDAKKLIDEIWQMKNFANAIEMELIRREYNDGTAS